MRSSDRLEDDVDMVIVGAGISGLVAARLLEQAGYIVAVVESRDRVGGRLLSPNVEGYRVDLGATWFWPGDIRVTALVDELGIRTHEQHRDGDAIYHDAAGSQVMTGNPLDVPSSRFTDGAQSLAEAVANELGPDVLRLGSGVTTVEVDTTGVRTGLANGARLSAAHLVLALPPALALERITFTPGLPERVADLAAVTPVWMGAIAKVIVRYQRAFWRDRGLAGAAISHLGPMRELHDMSGPDALSPTLFGFVPRMADSPAPSPEAIRTQLGEIFGDEAPEPVQVIVADWLNDRDTSPVGVDKLSAYQTFGHPMYQQPTMGGRVHWASTETSPVSPGHIEGALFGAERAAAAIADQSPTSPTNYR
jgi:monoamine oxidase